MRANPIFSFAALFCFLAFARAEDAGTTPPAHIPFQLTFATTRVVFDETRNLLYATDEANKALHVVDLASGLAIRKFSFTNTPESLAITRDYKWLYVALLPRPHDSFRFEDEGNGFIAEFDLERVAKTREFAVNIDPGPILVTDDGRLIVIGGSQQLTFIKAFDISTGAMVGREYVRQLSHAALNPAQTLIYAGEGHTAGVFMKVIGLDPATGALVYRNDISEDLSNFSYGGFTLRDDGKFFLSRAGQVAAVEPTGEPNPLVRSTGAIDIQQSIFGPTNLNMFIAAAGPELRWYNLNTLYQVRTVALSNAPTYLGRVNDHIWAVSILNQSTRLQSVIDPTLASAGNQAPVISASVNPQTPTTRYEVSIDAGLTTDDNTSAGDLQFRWDLTGDGTFDLGWTNINTVSQRFLTPGQHKITVEVRDTWGAVSARDFLLNVANEPDPGTPAITHAPWRIPSEAADWAFDPTRRQLWISSTNNTLYQVNLDTGLAERQWTFPFRPESLAITPNGSRLFVALVTREHNYYWFENSGYVAEFDLASNTLAKTIFYPIDAGDIAVTDRYLFISGGSGGWTYVNAYDFTNGRLIGQAPVYNGDRVTAAPSQTKVFGATYYNPNSHIERFAFNPAGSFAAGVQSPNFAPEMNGVGGRVFVLPGETNVLGGGGGVYLDKPGAPNDMRLITNLALSPITDLARFTDTNQYAFVSGSKLAYVPNGTFTPAVYQLGQITHGIGVVGSDHFLLSVTNGVTAVQRRKLPSASAAVNEAPTLRLLANGAIFAHPAEVSVVAEVEDSDGGVASVEFFANNTSFGVVTNFPFAKHFTTLPPGNHIIGAVARDNWGEKSATQYVAFKITTRPTITWNFPVGIAVADPGSTFVLSVNASDADGGVREVRFYKNDLVATNFLGSAVQTNSPFTFIITNFNATTYYTAQAIDVDGITANAPQVLVQLAGPPGDEFYRPFTLTGTNVVVTSSNSSATGQLFEFQMLAGGEPRSIWWSWRPPVAGIYSVSTRGSAFDTILGVFTGTNIANLTSIAFNDDEPLRPPTSLVKFTAYPSTNYMIAVDGYRMETGAIRLELQLETPIASAPENDMFAARYFLNGTNFTINANNIAATTESNEPRHGAFAAGPSVWWEWRAPTNGIVEISTAGSAFDTVLAIYGVSSGSVTPSLQTLRAVTASDDHPDLARASKVAFYVPRATNYFIAVTGFNGSTGLVSLNLSFAAGTNTPPNDKFASRFQLSGSDMEFDWSNVGASAEPGEPNLGFQAPRFSVWWTWRAPVTGRAYIKLNGYGINPGATIFTGSTLTNLIYITTVSDSSKPGGLSFDAVGGVEYQIAADSLGAGVFNFALNQPAAPSQPQITLELSPGANAFLNIGSASGTAVLFQSSDLLNWAPVQTNRVEAGQKIALPYSPEPATFYRVKVE